MRRSRPRSRAKRAAGLSLAAVVLLAVVCVVYLGWLLGPTGSSRRSTLVVVRPGTTMAQVAARLQSHGLIRSARLFAWYATSTGYGRRMRPGEYRLSAGMSARQMLERMARGGSDRPDRVVTFPEGWTSRQMAAALVSHGILREPSAFLELVAHPDHRVRAPFALPEAGLEGFLFPDTYAFLPGSTPEQIAQTMVENFWRRFADKYSAQIARSGHSLPEIVTIASLIEREAEVPQDRRRIAGVIENRLRKHMRLQIDATLDYARGRHLSRVLYSDLRADSPYNTYQHAGLPPGPIANPGLDCLNAALDPERHGYLFYVAAPDGSHVFTRTEQEHLRQVARMRELRKQRAGGGNG